MWRRLGRGNWKTLQLWRFRWPIELKLFRFHFNPFFRHSAGRRKPFWYYKRVDCGHFYKFDTSFVGDRNEHRNLPLPEKDDEQFEKSIDPAGFEWFKAFKLLSPCSIRWVWKLKRAYQKLLASSSDVVEVLSSTFQDS